MTLSLMGAAPRLLTRLVPRSCAVPVRLACVPALLRASAPCVPQLQMLRRLSTASTPDLEEAFIDPYETDPNLPAPGPSIPSLVSVS